jgi:carboxylate-amine ligase
VPQAFDSRAEYDRLVETLVATGSLREPTKLYWDVRPSARQETLEFRVADSVMAVDEAVMVAGLVPSPGRHRPRRRRPGRPRPAAPTRAAAGGQVAGRPPRPGRQPGGRARRPARPRGGAGEAFLDELRPALEEAGDLEEVTGLVRATLAGGNGAARQREAFRRKGRLEDVVDLAVEATAS